MLHCTPWLQCTPKGCRGSCVHKYTAASIALLIPAARAYRSWFQRLIAHPTGAGVAVCIHSSLSCFAHFSSEGVWIMVSTVDCSFHCFAHFSSQGVQITVSMAHCTPKRGWCGSIQTLQFVLLCFTSAPRVCGSRFQRFTACTPKRG